MHAVQVRIILAYIGGQLGWSAVPAGVYFAAVMFMCTISVMMTVLVLNFHHRKPDMYKMPPWVSLLHASATTVTSI